MNLGLKQHAECLNDYRLTGKNFKTTTDSLTNHTRTKNNAAITLSSLTNMKVPHPRLMPGAATRRVVSWYIEKHMLRKSSKQLTVFV